MNEIQLMRGRSSVTLARLQQAKVINSAGKQIGTVAVMQDSRGNLERVYAPTYNATDTDKAEYHCIADGFTLPLAGAFPEFVNS